MKTGYSGSNDACCLGNFKVCRSRKPSGWICWAGGNRLGFRELSVLFLLLFLLGILQCSWEVAGWFWGAFRKERCLCSPVPPPTLQRAPLWLSIHPSGIYKKCIPVISAAGRMRWEDPKFKASMGTSETLSQTN